MNTHLTYDILKKILNFSNLMTLEGIFYIRSHNPLTFHDILHFERNLKLIIFIN